MDLGHDHQESRPMVSVDVCFHETCPAFIAHCRNCQQVQHGESTPVDNTTSPSERKLAIEQSILPPEWCPLFVLPHGIPSTRWELLVWWHDANNPAGCYPPAVLLWLQSLV